MIIDIIDDYELLNQDHIELIERVLQTAVDYLHLSNNLEVDISIVNNEEIQELNKQYRNLDKPTDVLSFALTENEELPNINELFSKDLAVHLGDIIISYPKIIEQAEDYGHSFERELAFLVVHGFLHLNGYDHQTEEDEKEMFNIQNEVLKIYGLER